MPVEILAEREWTLMRRAGEVAAQVLAHLRARVAPGISTGDIDGWAREEIARRGARPSPLGYQGYPAAICTSRNHVVCHGIPRSDERIEHGDIVNVDVTVEVDGYHGDTSYTLVIGEASAPARRVVEVSRRCLDAGIAAVHPGARLGDVGHAIQTLARAEGCEVVEEFGGHGIGRKMHMPPHVSHTGRKGTGLRLRPGLAFTIEPMITIGRPGVRVLDDGWTVVTEDGSPTAQFEHTLLVTHDGCEVLTRRVPAKP
jgi:methionyl aminopeptidase